LFKTRPSLLIINYYSFKHRNWLPCCTAISAKR